jgi:hypothetical protein
MRYGRLSALLVMGMATAPLGEVDAAEVADVIDADDGLDLFDFVGEIGYRRLLRRAKITREYNCDPNRATNPSRFSGDADTCGDAGPAGRLITAKEARYTRITHEMIPRFRVGLWHDLELSITAPIVITDTQEIRFAGNGGDPNGTVVDPTNSQIAPENGPQLFPIPTDGLPTRAGFGDMTFMLRWAPVSRERNPSRGEWALELGYLAPTGEVMRFGNEGVGRGTHRLLIGSAFSYRFPHVDPYARLGVEIPFAAKDSLFKDYGDAQSFVGPGPRVDFDMGAEFIPLTDPKRGLKVFIDVGLGASYQAAGRDYTALFDALALGAQRCMPDTAAGPGNCGRYNPGSRSAIADTPHDGITTVQEHLQIRGRLGVGAHLSENARVAFNLSLAHDTEHFISDATIGKDKDGSGRVEDPTNAGYDPTEHNPTFVPSIDSVGRRLRVEETTIFGLGLTFGVAF